jgi:signal transduction histidine kinase
VGTTAASERAETAAGPAEAGAKPRRPGLSVRARFTATVALLVTIGLAGSGLIVYVVELRRIDAASVREAAQELDEFRAFARHDQNNPTSAAPLSVQQLLRTFIERNVPDADELLVGWVEGSVRWYYPRDPLVDDPAFLRAAASLADDGGSTRIATRQGEALISTQPVRGDDVDGALVVVSYLDQDRGELRDTMRTYAIVAALSLLTIAWIAWWQAGRLLSPLRTLRRTAEEIGATDLSRRVPESGNDDLTALTRTLNGMLDRLETAFTAQRRFLDDAGHELKTPLTVLRGHLELIDPADPVETEETRTLLLDEVDRMARLVDDLILHAKSGRPDFLSVRLTDPADLVTAVLSKARALGDRRWVLDPGPDTGSDTGPLQVVVDDQRITQALLQLADNAVKHTSPGQEIGMGYRVGGDRLQWWVRDTGPGVHPADRQRVFERFERAYVPVGDEGFGLGLSIVAAISRAHGGTAYVEAPSSGAGSRFVIDIPVVRRDRPSDSVPEDLRSHRLGEDQEVPGPWPGS